MYFDLWIRTRSFPSEVYASWTQGLREVYLVRGIMRSIFRGTLRSSDKSEFLAGCFEVLDSRWPGFPLTSEQKRI